LILTQGYNTVRAAWSGVLAAHDSGETIPVAPCIDLPANSPPGSYPLRMMILTPDGGTPLPLIEGPATSRLYWGRQLTLGVVAVDAP